MINERPVPSNPYLKARGESQLRAKHAFERSAGWRYGLTFGVLLLLMTYVWDAAQWALVHAEFWWVRLALASVIILPLAILAGGIGCHGNWLFKLLVWALFGILSAYCAIHIPFDGAQFVLQWFDPNLRVVEFLPIPAAAGDSFGMLAALGACLGVLVGLLQTLVVNWAWDRSTDDSRLTLQGWALFLLSAPLAFAYAFLFDGTTHAPLRAPMQLIQSAVQSGLNDVPGQDHRAMELHRALVYLVGQQWRDKFTPDYTMRLAASEPGTVGESYVDVTFSNGFNWRCRITTYGEYAGACHDLNAEYSRYIAEFVPRGSFRCADCEMRVAPAAAEWRGQNGRALAAGEVFRVTHGAGSNVTVRVTSPNGDSFECLLSGANPVIVQQCN